jgi:hypothetical protein
MSPYGIILLFSHFEGYVVTMGQHGYDQLFLCDLTYFPLLVLIIMTFLLNLQ